MAGTSPEMAIIYVKGCQYHSKSCGCGVLVVLLWSKCALDKFWESTADCRWGQGSQYFPCDSPTSWHVHPVPPVSGERGREDLSNSL